MRGRTIGGNGDGNVNRSRNRNVDGIGDWK